MKQTSARHRLSQFASLFILTLLLASPLQADDWKRVTNKAGNFSALFPVDLKANIQTQVDKTAAGKVTSYFGEYYGDGILLAGSGADIPGIARLAGEGAVFKGSKETFLETAKGTEVSFKETKVAGAPARELLYKGNAYRGKGGPYQGRALLIIYKKRMYIINSVITKATDENKAMEKKLMESIEAK